jgi:hypothetical protein
MVCDNSWPCHSLTDLPDRDSGAEVLAFGNSNNFFADPAIGFARESALGIDR